MDKKHYQRLVLLPIVLLITALTHVLLLEIVPGSPEAWATEHPFLSQKNIVVPSAFSCLQQFTRFNLGYSYFLQKPVFVLIRQSLPTSFYLTLLCFLTLYPLSILLSIGLIASNHFCTTLHKALTALSALPSCLLYALLSIFSFYTPLTLLPYTFAILLLSLRRMAALSSLCVKHIQEEQQKPYVKMAILRQIPLIPLYKHYILKNSLRAIWIRLPKHFCQVLFSGTFMVEVLFSIQGFGRLSFFALKTQDYPLILGCLLTACFSISISYLLGDLIHQYVYHHESF